MIAKGHENVYYAIRNGSDACAEKKNYKIQR